MLLFVEIQSFVNNPKYFLAFFKRVVNLCEVLKLLVFIVFKFKKIEFTLQLHLFRVNP